MLQNLVKTFGETPNNLLPFVVSVDRLRQFFIRVGNDYSMTGYSPTVHALCWYEPDAFGINETKTFNCTEPLVGRYVTIHFNRSEYLSLCEVEVYSDIGMYAS